MKKFKDIVKVNPEPAKGKLVNPADPWHLKTGIAESSLLDRYLSSRGINPKFVSKETKISHAKSGEFMKWKQDHVFEQTFQHTPTQSREHMLKRKQRHGVEIKTEEVDKKDTITLDIPFLIRVLEYAREDAKDDMALHKVVEKLIEIRNKGTLTMDDYDFVTKIKEEMDFDSLDESALEKFRAAAAQRAKEAEQRRKEMEARHAQGKEDMKGAIDRLAKALNKEETVNEGFKVGDAVRHKDGLHGTVTKDEDKDGIVSWKGPTAGYRVSHSSVLTKNTKVPRWRKQTNEDAYQDTYAATQMPFDGANSPNDTVDMKKEMSKSARIIKAIYKKKGVVKEDLYDWEKEDKSVKSYGKKPKMEKIEGEKEPQARAVMTGGKTMTGQNRDMVEIDPSMKTRPNSPDVFDTPGKKK